MDAGVRQPPSERAAAGSVAVAVLLLVSDHLAWADRVRCELAGEGFEVAWDRHAESAFEPARIGTADLVLVDLRMRRHSGLAVCGALRSGAHVPIVALGDATDEHVVLAAYAAGADQYVPADSSVRVLVARIRALLRRAPSGRSASEVVGVELPYAIDEASGSVITAGAVVGLSRRELEVLRALLARPGRVVTRSELARAWPSLGPDRRLDFVIRRLRQKLETVDGQRRISAVRGVGFRFELDATARSGGGGAG